MYIPSNGIWFLYTGLSIDWDWYTCIEPFQILPLAVSVIVALYSSPILDEDIDAVNDNKLSLALYLYALIEDDVFANVYIFCNLSVKTPEPVGFVRIVNKLLPDI
jgi:hypothetical protein